MKKHLLAVLTLTTLCALNLTAADELERGFTHPPDSARPWVYWFWLNGNITSNGITADLEAMKRVGIGGVLIMEVDQGAPVGPADFMGRAVARTCSSMWSAEARRLGLEVNMNNDAGWNGSGGPWIKPEQSMQKVVWTETNLAGPRRFEGALGAAGDRGRVLPGHRRAGFPDVRAPIGSRAFGRRRCSRWAASANLPAKTLPAEMVIDREPGARPDLAHGSRRAAAVGRARGAVDGAALGPHEHGGGKRAGAARRGRGLECDKLSKEGIEANFAGMMAKLAADTRVKPGQAKAGLVATHIDSWENGSQNWTAKMREEFQKRRGYDLLPFLPVMTGRVVGSPEISERFLWDLRQTVSELVVENYAGHMRELAHAAGHALHRGGLRQPVRLPFPTRASRTSRWASSGARAARWRPAGAWPRPGTFTGSGSSARRPSPPPTRRSGASIRPRSRRWATRRSARASTALCSTATRCSPGRRIGARA